LLQGPKGNLDLGQVNDLRHGGFCKKVWLAIQHGGNHYSQPRLP